MRIKLCFWLLLALVPFDVFGRQKLRTESDTINALIGITRIENIKGQKLSVVKKMFDSLGIPIRYFSIEGTSPWIDPNGRCYLERVQVGYLTPDELDDRVSNEQRWVLILDITLSPPYTVDITSLEKKYPLEDERIDAATRLAMIQDKFTIQTIKCWYIRPMK